MPIIFAAGYIIIRLVVEAYQKRQADEYANMVVRRYK